MHWADIYQDKYAVKRLQKTASLLEYWPGLRILDIGANTEELKKHLPSCVIYEGIDLKDCDLNIEVKGKLPFYDYIFCLEVLEHLYNPEIVMQYIKTHSRYAIISIPNENTFYHRFKMFLGFGCDDLAFRKYKHLHLPTIKEMLFFLSQYSRVLRKVYYISPSMCSSRAEWLGRLIKILPDKFHQALADIWPSLFARGVIFLIQTG